jgi:hypothetical protein
VPTGSFAFNGHRSTMSLTKIDTKWHLSSTVVMGYTPCNVLLESRIHPQENIKKMLCNWQAPKEYALTIN